MRLLLVVLCTSIMFPQGGGIFQENLHDGTYQDRSPNTTDCLTLASRQLGGEEEAQKYSMYARERLSSLHRLIQNGILAKSTVFLTRAQHPFKNTE